jgi:hypothetical protein
MVQKARACTATTMTAMLMVKKHPQHITVLMRRVFILLLLLINTDLFWFLQRICFNQQQAEQHQHGPFWKVSSIFKDM